MMLQAYARSGSGVDYEFMRDSIESIHFYSKDELLVNYRNGSSESYHNRQENQIHTMFLLNDEGKTLKALWRKPPQKEID